MKISNFKAKEAFKKIDTLVNNIVWDVAYELEDTYNIKKPEEIEIDCGEHVAYLFGRFEAMQEIANQIKLLTKDIEKND